jgi:hypothetical protein
MISKTTFQVLSGKFLHLNFSLRSANAFIDLYCPGKEVKTLTEDEAEIVLQKLGHYEGKMKTWALK